MHRACDASAMRDQRQLGVPDECRLDVRQRPWLSVLEQRWLAVRERLWLVGAAGCAVVLGCSSEDESPKNQVIGKPDASLIEAAADSPPDQIAVDADAGPPYDGPGKLSETGLYADISSKQLATQIRPFDVRQPIWMDGATSKRFVLLPTGEKIDTKYMEVWKFPIGTKAWKEVSVQGKPVETRFLWKRAEGDEGWLKVSFQWSSAGDEAYAVPAGSTVGDHDIPSSETCTQCHNGQGDGLIGFAAVQLSQEPGGGYLSTLIAEGLLTNPPAGEFPTPGDGNVEKVLLYMHANCGHCHSDEYWLSEIRKLRLKLLTSQVTPETTGLYATTINTPMDHNVEGTTVAVIPGKPAQSQLYLRTGMRGFNGMPPFDTKEVDPEGMQILGDWISSLP